MTRPPKSSPVVLRIKKIKLAVNRTVPSAGEKRGPKKRGPEPCYYGSRMNGPPAIRKEVDPDNHRSAWRNAFGNRLRIDEERGFFLDGRPIDLDTLMLETNRIRKANGLDPVGRKPEWLP